MLLLLSKPNDEQARVETNTSQDLIVQRGKDRSYIDIVQSPPLITKGDLQDGYDTREINKNPG